jgi:hypothetical protein
MRRNLLLYLLVFIYFKEMISNWSKLQQKESQFVKLTNDTDENSIEIELTTPQEYARGDASLIGDSSSVIINPIEILIDFIVQPEILILIFCGILFALLGKIFSDKQRLLLESNNQFSEYQDIKKFKFYFDLSQLSQSTQDLARLSVFSTIIIVIFSLILVFIHLLFVDSLILYIIGIIGFISAFIIQNLIKLEIIKNEKVTTKLKNLDTHLENL